jgi:mono/diheme cytochrome c family protein
MKLTGLIGALFLLVIILVIASCQSNEQLEFNRYYSQGSLIYQAKCQNCHGSRGEGLRGLIPPLTDSHYIKTNLASIACFVKFGLKGKVTISGRSFEGEMPPNDLASIEIAEALTYVTNSFGNEMGTFNSAQAEADLEKCR